ncbi:MAG: response regulator, partial [Comamonas sp.]|nr:response regulator [Candidatus Comamonas equi]
MPVHGLQSLMVVDDSPVQRAHAVQLCRAAGVALVYEAGNGLEALEQLAMLNLLPDLLLVDLHMPDMDGVELITQLHERDWEIPILIVSSQQTSILNAVDELARTLNLPLMGFLAKPLVAERLELALQRVHTSPLRATPAQPRHALPITSG